MKRSWTHWILAAALIAATPTLASACDLFDGCPDGGFVLECGCVLCMPGYAHTKTGETSNSGYDCWTCAPARSKAQAVPNRCKIQQQEPIPHPVLSVLASQGFEEMLPELPLRD